MTNQQQPQQPGSNYSTFIGLCVCITHQLTPFFRVGPGDRYFDFKCKIAGFFAGTTMYMAGGGKHFPALYSLYALAYIVLCVWHSMYLGRCDANGRYVNSMYSGMPWWAPTSMGENRAKKLEPLLKLIIGLIFLAFHPPMAAIFLSGAVAHKLWATHSDMYCKRLAKDALDQEDFQRLIQGEMERLRQMRGEM